MVRDEWVFNRYGHTQELVQGPCKKNQEDMVTRTNLLLLCNRVFVYVSYAIDRPESEEAMAEKSALKCALLGLLTSLLERTPHGSLVRARMVNLLEFQAFKVR